MRAGRFAAKYRLARGGLLALLLSVSAAALQAQSTEQLLAVQGPSERDRKSVV